MPFLTDQLWRVLTAPCEDAPASVHLAGWPEQAEVDTALLAEIAELRRVVELGRQARATSGMKLRQPLRALVVEGAPLAEGHADEVADELRVREVEFGPVEASQLRVKPNLPVLGPKLGRSWAQCGPALQSGDFEELPGWWRSRRRARALVRRGARRARGQGGLGRWRRRTGSPSPSTSTSTTISFDAGRVYDLIHSVNTLRKESGLDLTDRIALTIPAADTDLLEHEDWIARETLAVSVEAGGAALALAKSAAA
jgi:isoleucyl-tRNA synthetase